jgi:hypothetical protein
MIVYLRDILEVRAKPKTKCELTAFVLRDKEEFILHLIIPRIPGGGIKDLWNQSPDSLLSKIPAFRHASFSDLTFY